LPRSVAIPAKCEPGTTDPQAATRLKSFLDQIFVPTSPVRLKKESIWNRGRLYRQGDQWLMPLVSDGTINYNWIPIRLGKRTTPFPMPVVQKYSPAIENEAARLVGVGSKPSIITDDDDPATVKGARYAKNALQDLNRRMNFDDQQARGTYHMPQYGQWIQKDWWGHDELEKTRIAVATAVGCPNCDYVLADKNLPPDQGKALAAQAPHAINHQVFQDPANPYTEPRVLSQANACPNCPPPPPPAPPSIEDMAASSMGAEGAPAPPAPPAEPPWPYRLQPYAPTFDEAATRKDALGRTLGEDVPLGDVMSEVVSPWDWWPEGGGLETDIHTMQEFGQESIRSIPWIKRHYPKTSEGVRAENASEMFEHHPVLGSFILSGYVTEGILDNHCRVREWYCKPTAEFPHGRAMVIALGGNIVLMDDDYEIESLQPGHEGTFVPRVEYDVAQWEERDREVWGISMGEYGLFKLQDVINLTKSQIQDIRQKWLSPKMIFRSGMNVRFAGGPGSQFPADSWTIDSADPNEKPFVFGNTAPDTGVYQEMDRDERHVQDLAGQGTAELGNVAPNTELNYSALLLAANKSAERRKPRIDRTRRMKVRRYEYRLLLMQEMYAEDRLMRVLGTNDKTTLERFTGLSFNGQIRVEFEDEPLVDVSIARRASLKQSQEMGALKVDTAAGAREINRLLELPADINKHSNIQVERAEEEFQRWKKGYKPGLDPQGDEHMAHFNQHEDDLRGRDAIDKIDSLGPNVWSQVLAACYTWNRALKAIEGAELLLNQAMAAAQAPPPPGPPPDAPRSEAMHAQVAKETIEQKRNEQIAALEQQVTPFPKDTQGRIEMLWTAFCAPIMPTLQPVQQETLAQLIIWKAHSLAHWNEVQVQALQAMAGMPQASAPGAQQTPEGMVPMPGGGPVVPAPGTGPAQQPTPGGV
jgi:hypothetical protein